jgi:hypothetical protein
MAKRKPPTEKQLAVLRANAFKPGNPGGNRPKGVVARIKAMTNDGQDLLEFFQRVATGQDDDFGPRERIQAAQWLADHTFGRAVQTTVQVEAQAQQTEGAIEIADDQLEALARGLKAAPPAGPPQQAVVEAVVVAETEPKLAN